MGLEIIGWTILLEAFILQVWVVKECIRVYWPKAPPYRDLYPDLYSFYCKRMRKMCGPAYTIDKNGKRRILPSREVPPMGTPSNKQETFEDYPVGKVLLLKPSTTHADCEAKEWVVVDHVDSWKSGWQAIAIRPRRIIDDTERTRVIGLGGVRDLIVKDADHLKLTLDEILAFKPCDDGFKRAIRLAQGKPRDYKFDLYELYEAGSLPGSDAIWLLEKMGHNEARWTRDRIIAHLKGEV